MEDVERVDMRPRESLECARDYGNHQLTNYGKASTPLLVAFHVIHNNNVVNRTRQDAIIKIHLLSFSSSVDLI